jgi:PAS domain S-box-containing protein
MQWNIGPNVLYVGSYSSLQVRNFRIFAQLILARTRRGQHANQAFQPRVPAIPMPLQNYTQDSVRAVLDVLPSLCFVVDTDGTVLVANRSAQRIMAASEHELVGIPFASLIQDKSRDIFLKELQSELGEFPEWKFDARLRSPADRTIIASVCVTAFPGGHSPGMRLVIARDITKERENELDLLRFANVAKFTVNPLEITDPQGKIIYANPAFERASGYTLDEILGKNPNIFGSGKYPKSFWKRMWDTIRSGEVWTGEVENRRRNGEPFFTQLLISPIEDAEKNIIGYFGIHRDITHQRNLERQLVQAQKMESIGMLAAGLAHEVGNPLTSISSLVQVIQRTTNDQTTKDRLSLIKSQITRISRIIRELVDFSRQSNSEMRVTDINRVIAEAVDIVRVGNKSKAVTFTLELDPALPQLKLVADKLQQVFINILINAVDALQETALQRPPEITITSATTHEDVRIALRDNGPGIPGEAIPKIFDPFYTTKPVGQGTGLGLWVSFTIIKSFNGDFRVESSEGEGTTFNILLPIRSPVE